MLAFGIETLNNEATLKKIPIMCSVVGKKVDCCPGKKGRCCTRMDIKQRKWIRKTIWRDRRLTFLYGVVRVWAVFFIWRCFNFFQWTDFLHENLNESKGWPTCYTVSRCHLVTVQGLRRQRAHARFVSARGLRTCTADQALRAPVLTPLHHHLPSLRMPKAAWGPLREKLISSPGINEYLARNPIPSSSSSELNLIHMNLPVDLISGGLFTPQNRSMSGEKPNGPSRISKWSKRHSNDGSM